MDDLVLTLRATIAAGTLLLNYTVQNRTEHDAYLLNRLFSDSPPALSADIAYVELDPSTETASVRKGIPDLPPGMSGPPVPVAPYVTPVRAGASFSETVRLALPLRIARAYGRSPQPRPGHETIAAFHGVTFNLQYYWREPGVSEKADTAFGQPVVVPYGFRTAPRFGLLRAHVAPIDIPVVIPTN